MNISKDKIINLTIISKPIHDIPYHIVFAFEHIIVIMKNTNLLKEHLLSNTPNVDIIDKNRSIKDSVPFAMIDFTKLPNKFHNIKYQTQTNNIFKIENCTIENSYVKLNILFIDYRMTSTHPRTVKQNKGPKEHTHTLAFEKGLSI